MFNSPQEVQKLLNENNYICNKQVALTVYLGYKLNKPIYVCGDPGVGKSQLAKTVSYILNKTDPIRLQCYDGLTAEEALYSWNYQKQLLYIQNKTQDWNKIEEDLYTEAFISPRPLYKAITSNKQQVLLIDELDKADEDFESFLLEFLGEQQITINETKTIKAKSNPFVFITSNDKRDLTDAFKRRCLFCYIEHPDMNIESMIIRKHVPNINNLLLTQITEFISKLRKDKLDKIPSISESIDWAKVLMELNVFELSEDIIRQTLNVIVKTQNDLSLADRKVDLYSKQLTRNTAINNNITSTDEDNIELNTEEVDMTTQWDF